MHKIEIEFLARIFVEALHNHMPKSRTLTSVILQKMERSNRITDFEIAVFERLKFNVDQLPEQETSCVIQDSPNASPVKF